MRRVCSQCFAVASADQSLCSRDGAPLLPFDNQDSRCGTVIDERFILLDRLGQGAMGKVYVAWQLTTQRRVALKVLDPLIGWKQQDLVPRFKREAEITAALESRHTVTIHDSGVLPDGSLYIAMELLRGRTLEEIIKAEAPLAPERVRHLALQICDSLGDAHRKRVVHRDLKPGNLMVRKNERGVEELKVLDFGIAKVLDQSFTSLTMTGLTMGTPAYMSPEQFRGEEAGPASDIYAVGVMLFLMLTGRLPFGAPDAASMMYHHLGTPPPRLANRLESLAGARTELVSFDRIIQRCLAKKPQDRYASVDMLGAELERLQLAGRRRQHGGPHLRWPMVALVLLVGCGALGGAAWLGYRLSQPSGVAPALPTAAERTGPALAEAPALPAPAPAQAASTVVAAESPAADGPAAADRVVDGPAEGGEPPPGRATGRSELDSPAGNGQETKRKGSGMAEHSRSSPALRVARVSGGITQQQASQAATRLRPALVRCSAALPDSPAALAELRLILVIDASGRVSGVSGRPHLAKELVRCLDQPVRQLSFPPLTQGLFATLQLTVVR